MICTLAIKESMQYRALLWFLINGFRTFLIAENIQYWPHIDAKIPRFLQNFINIDGFKNQALKISWFNQTYADSAPTIDTLNEAIDTRIILTFHTTNHAKWTLILGAPFRQVWSVWDPIVLGVLVCWGPSVLRS